MSFRKQVITSQHTVLIAGMFLALAWWYQGLIPKIIFTDTGELEVLKQTGLLFGHEKNAMTFIGLAEIVFGFIILFVQRKVVHYINIVVLVLLAIGAGYAQPDSYFHPFNPFSLNISMIAISFMAIINLGTITGTGKEQGNQ